MSQALALSPDELAEVKAILSTHLPPDVRVGVFGSRARGEPKRWSDLDLVLTGSSPLALSLLAELAEAFELSDLPWRVDIVDRLAVSAPFGDIIDRAAVPL